MYQRAPGSAFELAKLLSFTIVPVFLIGPVAGVYVDRWDRRRTMYISDFLRFVFILSIPLFFIGSGTLIPIYIIVFLSFAIGRFFIPAKMSIIPELVKKEELLLSNSLVSTTGVIAAGLGLGIGGIIVDAFGPKGGFLIDAFGFLLSSLLIYLITKKALLKKQKISELSKEIVEVIRKSVISEIKGGLLYIFRLKAIRLVVILWFILWAGLGSTYVIIIVFVQDTLQSATKDLGLLSIFLCSGLFVGSMIYGRFFQKFSNFVAIFISLLSGGLVLAVFAYAVNELANFNTAAIIATILGFALSPMIIASNTLIHKHSDDTMRGKTFSALEIFGHLAFLIFMLLGSAIAEHLAHYQILIGVGITFASIGLFGLLNYRKLYDSLERI